MPPFAGSRHPAAWLVALAATLLGGHPRRFGRIGDPLVRGFEERGHHPVVSQP